MQFFWKSVLNFKDFKIVSQRLLRMTIMPSLVFDDFYKVAHQFESSYFQIGNKSTWHKMWKVQKDIHWKVFSHSCHQSPSFLLRLPLLLVYCIFPQRYYGIIQTFNTNGTIIVHTMVYLFSSKVNFSDWAVNNVILFNNYMIFYWMTKICLTSSCWVVSRLLLL